jgi:hypothetical protein
MKKFTKDNYIKLLERLVEEQYTTQDETIAKEFENTWIPSTSKAKEKLNKSLNSSIADLSNIKKDEIENYIYNHRDIKVGDFLLKIVKYSIKPSDLQDGHKKDLEVDIIIYEYNDLGMATKVDVKKDSRFIGRPWITYFSTFKIGKNVDIQSTVDIIRWLQAINRIGCFI